MPPEHGPERVVAFAPGRVNLIGEHTDYNLGLALPFAIAEGVTVEAERLAPGGGAKMLADALDVGEHDEFDIDAPQPVQGWRAFVRGTVAELHSAGVPLSAARLTITGDIPRGAGLSSSAALEVALALALLSLAGAKMERLELAQLCARVENDWVGARTGLLDQLASLFGEPHTALMIDFRSLQIEPVPLRLDGWQLVTLDSGEGHANAASGYNERRAECERACELLGLASLREADPATIGGLPEPLRRRATHVLEENERVRATAQALRSGELGRVGELLNASHASLRKNYEVSSPALDAAVERLLQVGAAGARMIGGGFGGSVLGLLPRGVEPPTHARIVRPSASGSLRAT
ncbi:MAG TPA: galactokinase [Solirubrobacteraceae bacterium]